MKRLQKNAVVIDGQPLNVHQAARYLREHLGEKDDYWRLFLINNRKPLRHPAHRIAFTKARGIVVYEKEALADFVGFEKQRRLTGMKFTGRAAEAMLAYGIGTLEGGAYGRTLSYHLTAQSNESEVFAALVLEKPSLVFRLPLDQVERMAADLTEVARVLRERVAEAT